MKKSLITFVVVGGGIIIALAYLNKQKPAPPVPAPVVESATSQPAAPAPEKVSAQKTEAPAVLPTLSAPTKIAATSATVETKTNEAANAIHKTVDDLLSAKSAKEKHELFQQLVKSGRIDQAIAELKQRAADNPNDAGIPTTLGEAQLNKLRALHESGGDYNEIGILAMQSDQSFNAALKIDPANYEAQLVKAISMTFWPADPARDGQVVQTLSSLIDRQETMTSQPDFAQTYLYLGNEYQKIGQPDKAQAAWQLGLQKFPNDPALQKKISGP